MKRDDPKVSSPLEESSLSKFLFAGIKLSFYTSIGNTIKTTMKGVENVYTQHKPLLYHTLENIVRGKLKETTFPAALPGPGVSKPTEVILFMVGGTTYEESLRVNEFNQTNPGVRFILGGSTIHNWKSFLEEIRQAF